MRFVCEKCQTRYTIPDEKARGRALKVRCKKCGNVIELKPEARASDPSPSHGESASSPRSHAGDSPRSVIAPRAFPPAGEPEGSTEGYFAIVLGEQLGPLTSLELESRIRAGSIGARTYVWREELPDWKRLEDLGALVALLPAAVAAKPRPAPAVPEVAVHASVAAEKLPTVDKVRLEALFGDEGAKGEAPAPEGAQAIGALPIAAPIDPFKSVPDAPGLISPGAPGEMTRFLIAQSGIEKRRSPARIAAFASAALAFVGSGLFLLSRLTPYVPLVSGHSSAGVKFFTGPGSGDGALRELLMGRRAAKGAAKGQVGVPTHLGRSVEAGPLARKETQHVDKLDEIQRATLRSLYGKQGMNDLKIASAGQGSDQAIDRPDAPLTPQQVAATVAHFQSGYGSCIDRELKRNPGFHGGKIRIVTTITSSGLVRGAKIESDDDGLARRLGSGLLGGCLIDQTRRMVFPSFSGEAFDAEIPLVLGSSM